MGEWGGGGGRASPLAVFYLSVRPWRLFELLGTTKGGGGQRKNSAAIRRQSKSREEEGTSLQVNSEKQLAGS